MTNLCKDCRDQLGLGRQLVTRAGGTVAGAAFGAIATSLTANPIFLLLGAAVGAGVDFGRHACAACGSQENVAETYEAIGLAEDGRRLLISFPYSSGQPFAHNELFVEGSDGEIEPFTDSDSSTSVSEIPQCPDTDSAYPGESSSCTAGEQAGDRGGGDMGAGGGDLGSS